MNTKLTLNIEEAVIEKAKLAAKKRKKSLSKIVEQYLLFIANEQNIVLETSESVARLEDRLQIAGSADDLKYQYLADKYLNDTDPR